MDTPARPGNGRVLMLNANFPASSTLEAATYIDPNTNIGNGYIAYCILKILGIEPGEVTICNNIWRPLSDKRAIVEASERCDRIFFNFQDQLRTVFPDEEYETALETLRTPHPATKMVAFSLSANTVDEPDLVKALSPARWRFFDYLAQRCISIGVRGPYTAEILAKMQITNVGVVGCPSYFEHGPGRIVQTPEQRVDRQCLGTRGRRFAPLKRLSRRCMSQLRGASPRQFANSKAFILSAREENLTSATY
jgi:hypothetical protein